MQQLAPVGSMNEKKTLIIRVVDNGFIINARIPPPTYDPAMNVRPGEKSYLGREVEKIASTVDDVLDVVRAILEP